MPRNAAVVRLNALIDALPREPAIDIPAGTIAADLVALLPKDEKLNVRSPDSVFAAVRSGQTQILMALSAFVIMLFTVFLLSAILSPGPGNGANPAAPRGEDASTGMPRR
jgi:hypothetical protein